MRTIFLIFLSLFSTACVGGPEKPLFAQSPEEIFSDERVAELTRAAMKGDVKRIDTLVKNGVNVNAKGKGGLYPLTFTMLAHNLKGFEALLDHGANQNQLESDGETVVHRCINSGSSLFNKQINLYLALLLTAPDRYPSHHPRGHLYCQS